MRRPYVLTAVLIVGVVILLVEGFFIYRFYRNDYADGAASSSPGLTAREDADSPGDATTPENTSFETTAGEPQEDTAAANEPPEGTTFVHRASSENIVNNSTYIDNPLINQNPDAVLLVTRVSGSDDTVTDEHEIGVWYDANRGGRWAIFNQDLTAMRQGTVFNVIALEGPGKVVHRATASNTLTDSTYIDDPLTNDAPKAIISVTQSWNPGGGAGTYNDHPIGARYDSARDEWALFNRDAANMPEGAGFNVAVSNE